MKRREEPSTASTRGSQDSLSRSGRTASASVEQPAQNRHSVVRSLFPEMLMEAVVAKANMEMAGNASARTVGLLALTGSRWPSFRSG